VVKAGRDAELKTGAVTVAAVEDLPVIQDDRLSLTMLSDVLKELCEVVPLEEGEHIGERVISISHLGSCTVGLVLEDEVFDKLEVIEHASKSVDSHLIKEGLELFVWDALKDLG